MPEGPNRVVKVVTTPLQDGTDTAAGTLVVLGDITQQKMEQQAREDFISSVSHELRAPLAAIKGYVEMLLDDEANSPELRREFFNTMNEECDRLARLVDNMINISRIEIGGLVLNRSLVKTRKLLRDAVSAVAAQAKSKNITLQARIPDDLPDMDADKEMFRVAVMNLLGNALKYTSPGGSVALSGERVGDELRVHVVDTGWGISEEEQQKIFQKFYRGKEATDRKVTGNGLGLALTKEIATLHGGDVKLESKLGEGSKFTLVLPVR
jgi:signal transduction histidine kinase